MENLAIDEEGINPEEKLVVTEFKILSVKKFILLYILTFSLYATWWVYKGWRFFKLKENSDILPAVRTIFGIFFIIPFFNKILNFARSKGYPETYYPVILFIGLIGTFLVSRIEDSPLVLLAIMGFIFYLQPLAAFNYALNNSPEIEIEVQQGFNKRQQILMGIGSIIWIIALFGFYLMLFTEY